MALYILERAYEEEPVKDGYLTPQVQLLGMQAFKRVRHTCCDLYECNKRITPDLSLFH